MSPWYALVIFLSYFPVSYAECNVSDCSLLRHLECALYTTDSNEKRLNQAFFPPRKATSRYIKVDYVFDTIEVEEIEGDSCTVTYIWSIGGFLLIQPPTIFQLTSLMFSYPANDIDNVTLKLPSKCIDVINIIDGYCSCGKREGGRLDILTQQILQYSKYNNPEGVVRDLTSTAQALCVEDLESGYFTHTNVTLYISAKLILPVATSVASVTVISKYHPVLTEKVISSADRPNFVGLTIAGIYISLYILSVDAAAITFYLDNTTDYRDYENIRNSLSLQLTYITFISECIFLIVALCVAVFCHQHKGKYQGRHDQHIFLIFSAIMIQVHISLVLLLVSLNAKHHIITATLQTFIILCLYILYIIFYLKSPIIFFLTWLVIMPLIFVSSHIDYILVAWLTEPAKTTSVSILALAILFYLYSLTRFLYNFITDILSKFPKLNKEILKLLLTFLFGLFGVGLAALQIAAFYLLPIPSIKLADYLDNFFQISLVILAGLITYKVISNQESDLKKFLKRFSNAYEQDLMSQKNDIIAEPVSISAELITTIEGENQTLKASKGTTILVVTIPQHKGSIKTIIPLAEVYLDIQTHTNGSGQSQASLESGSISFRICSAASTQYCKTLLKDAKLIIRNQHTKQSDGTSVANIECIFPDNDAHPYQLYRKSLYQDSSDIISLEDKEVLLSVPIQCYIVNSTYPGIDKGAKCHFHNSVSLHDFNELSMAIGIHVDRILLPPKSIPIIKRDRRKQTIFLEAENSHLEIKSLANAVTLTRHNRSIWLKYTLSLENRPIQIKSTTERTVKFLIFKLNLQTVKIPLEHIQKDIIITLEVTSSNTGGNPRVRLQNPQPGLQDVDLNIVCDTYTLCIHRDYDTHTRVILSRPHCTPVFLDCLTDFRDLRVVGVKSANLVFRNKTQTDVKLKNENQVLKVSLRSGKKQTEIQTSEDNHLTLQLDNSLESPSLSLFIPFNNDKNGARNEFERAGLNCGNIAQSLVAPHKNSTHK